MNNNEGTEFVAKYSGKYRHFKKKSYFLKISLCHAVSLEIFFPE